ncbi:VOC family protein [Oceanobacillus jeddahense]|uniref:VOC family protein n=1 Tax=Oceanobacillus jeddahense TaxID=1462527 RepID=A0ABY5JXG7_9BACI|nr:VOC family protein [Oceanobacillus jeddahense]UUI05088.1 VOC family protein [Oceanobacillus jeddahense]
MTFQLERLDHIQLSAPKGSEKTAREFYKDILGFMEEEKPKTLKPNGGVWFRKGEIAIHIGIEEPFEPLKKAHPAFDVSGIDALQIHLEKAGISTKWDNKLPNARRFYVRDPFGNRLEFLEWQGK